MRLSRYYQQEQLTDQSSAIFQPRPFTSPLETIGEGLSSALERTAAQDQQAYAASESARALAKISEVADGINQDISAGKILDQNSLDEALRTRVDSSFGELGLQPKIRRMIQPELTQQMATYGIKLKHAMDAKRGEIEVANTNTALDSFKRAAIEATTPSELTQAIDTIRKTVDGVEGTFLSPEQKQKYIESALDFIHTARVDRLLQNPALDPTAAQAYLNEHKAEIAPETFEKLNEVVADRIQTGIKNETLYGLMDQIDAAERSGGISLNAVRQSIDAHRKEFTPSTIFSLQSMVDQVDNRRRAEAAKAQVEQGQLVINQVERILTINDDPAAASAILQKNRGVLDRNTVEDAQLKIDLYQKSKIDQKERFNQAANTEFFQNRIDSGEFDSFTSQQMRDQIMSEIEVGKNLPGESLPRLMNSYFNRLQQTGKNKITLEMATQKITAGHFLDQKETDIAYANRPASDPNDPNWMNQEITFAVKTAKNIPTPWIDFVKNAPRLSPTAENMQSVDQAAEYVTQVAKENPSIANTFDKDALLLLPDYWDRAGKIQGMDSRQKAEVWKNLLKSRYSPNEDRINQITSSSDFTDIKDDLWKQSWDWYSKFAPEQQNVQTEFFRNEPNMPPMLKLEWSENFKKQLKATTGEDGIPNFERASEYAYQQLFQNWGLTEVYGKVDWQYKPIDQLIRKTPFSADDVREFIDGEVEKGIKKNVIHESALSQSDPLLGSALSFGNPMPETVYDYQIRLQYVADSEKKNPISGWPNYLIVVDGDAQPIEGGWCGIKGDELFQFLKDRNNTKNSEQFSKLKEKRDVLNQEMNSFGLSMPTQAIIPD
jgi:hypothetical protein